MKKLLLVLWFLPLLSFASQQDFQEKYAPVLDNFPKPTQWLILAIVSCESGFNENAVNKVTNDFGLFQIHETHFNEAKNMHLDVVNEPTDNFLYGLTLLMNEGIFPWRASWKCISNYSPDVV